MALSDRQKQEALDLYSKGYSTSQVFRHFGAQSIGKDSEIDIEQSAIETAEQKPALKPLANKITGMLGLGGATKTFGDIIAQSKLGNRLATPAQKEVAAQTGMTPQEVNLNQMTVPTNKEVGGAFLQTGSVLAGAALAPASLPAQVAAGAALGYTYDVGSDLVEGKSTAETLTPGLGTAVGTVAPPLLRGAGALLRGPSTAATADDLARMATGEAARDAAEQAVTPTQGLGEALKEKIPGQISETGSAVRQTGSDLLERVKRTGQRIANRAEEQAIKAERLANATPAVREAIKSELDDTIIEIATSENQATREAIKKMVDLAESPRTGRATQLKPTDVSADAAVQQFDTIVAKKKEVGSAIGELSDQLPTAKNIDVLPAQRNLRDTLRQNGIIPDASGTLRFENEALLPEQQAVIQTLYDKATKDSVFSAKTIHQMDQFFSSTQRKSRLVDKIDDVYVKVKTPDGVRDVNIYKLFRDVFGQQLDEAVPEIKPLNREYRQLANLVDDIEGGIARDPNFASLNRDDRFASAGLRQMFGEGVKSRQLADLYEIMDSTSRGLGYDGARADELYYVANKLRDIYPDTIPDTGLRGNIGSSIKDIAGNILGAGKADAVDQQKALKLLLEESSS